ncbi:MAG: ABC transporter permease [Thermoanaerobaculia bacterium]|nr:ABC transporter permease [Thermoanaerobaculia bacterium]
MVSLARRNLLHDRLRFVITISGVAFAVSLVFIQAGLFAGLLDNATVTIDNISADLWVTPKNTPTIDFSQPIPGNLVSRVRSVPGVESADNLIVAFGTITLPAGTREGILIYAMENFRAWSLPWDVREGNVEDLARIPSFFLDSSALRRFGPFSIGEYREISGRRLKIIGRTEGARSFTTSPIAFMDFDLAQSLVPEMTGKSSYIVVKAGSGANLESIRAEIKKRLPHYDVHSKAEWSEQSRSYWITNTGIGMNLFMTVLLGVLVGVVVVAQTLYTSTMEHIKEFGTVKAIGGSNLDIYRILGEQALISAVAGYVLGGLMSMGAAPFMKKLDLKLIVSTEFALIVFAGTIVMCLLASMVSFKKVASIDPALVFRS